MHFWQIRADREKPFTTIAIWIPLTCYWTKIKIKRAPPPTPIHPQSSSGKYSKPSGLQELFVNGNWVAMRQSYNKAVARWHSCLQIVYLAHTLTHKSHTRSIPSCRALKRGTPTPGNQLGEDLSLWSKWGFPCCMRNGLPWGNTTPHVLKKEIRRCVKNMSKDLLMH